MRFEDTNLIPELLKAVSDAGYEAPTRIQEDTIPLALMGRDVLGCAQTGTGKTAAFALPILQRLYLGEKELYGGRTAGSSEVPTQFARTMDEAYGRVAKESSGKKTKKRADDRNIRALVLTPTRELALQIEESFELYGKHLPLRSCVIFGGVSQNPQTEQLKKGVDILVATPGRLNDLIGQGFVSLSNLEIFVLDEADRMLDMGFIHDVRRVMTQLPPVRQTLLFSATMPPEVEKLALELLYQPISVKVNPPTSTVDAIHQTVYFIDKANKRKLLLDLLKKPEVESALVFVRTKHGADRVARDLTRGGIQANSIHGDKSQGARQDALAKFKAGKIKALVATDIAARGIDIFGLSHVFNYDVPNEPETYIHRIGRTGRAGLAGEAITFCCYDELEMYRAVEKLIDKNIEETPSPYPMEVFTSSGERIGRPPVGAEKSRGSDRGRRKDDQKKYGHDKKEKERRFPKEEWFDPETEDVIETVKGSSFDETPKEGAPKKKRRRRRKKKTGEAAAVAAVAATAAIAIEATKKSEDEQKPKKSRSRNKKKTKEAEAPKQDSEPKKEKKPFQEHTKIEAQGSVLKHRPQKQKSVTVEEPDDDFMPQIVFKNNEKNEPKKNVFGNIFHFAEKENGPKPTDELNTEIIETRTWQGSRGQRPKVVDRRKSDDDDTL